MRLKTYFATGVDAAMMLARQELGPDAMLVHSKRTAGEAQSLGSHEVVFALPEEVPSVQSPANRSVSASSIPSGFSEELAGLRSLVEQTNRLVRRSETILKSHNALTGEPADLDAVLEDAGFSVDLRQRLLVEAQTATGPLRQCAAIWFDRHLRVASHLGKSGFARKTVALVGPAGAGKTTALVKLATQFGVAGRRPAQILSVDTDRVGVAESLRIHAGVLGVGFQLLDTTHALSQALAEHAHKDLILIDTPGYSTGSIVESADLALFLSSRKEIDTHLVLPADLPAASLRVCVDRFAAFHPGKLLFTRVDEALQLGPLIETAILAGLPLSFVANGQRIPEDLAAADKASLLDRVLPRSLEESHSERPRSRWAAA
jgi:flagellar biosynthesis protein FlhF